MLNYLKSLSLKISLGIEPIDPKADEIAGIAVGQIYFEKYMREYPNLVSTMALEATQKDTIDDSVSMFTQESSERVFQTYGKRIYKDREKLARILNEILEN